jgi:hypothetical protein
MTNPHLAVMDAGAGKINGHIVVTKEQAGERHIPSVVVMTIKHLLIPRYDACSSVFYSNLVVNYRKDTCINNHKLVTCFVYPCKSNKYGT